MPAKSVAQQHLFQAAEHGASFPMAKKIQHSMSHEQMHDFSTGSEAGKPQHVLKGDTQNIVKENTNTFKNAGKSEFDATRAALQTAKKSHPNRHKNLGGFLHKKKSLTPKGRNDDFPNEPADGTGGPLTVKSR